MTDDLILTGPTITELVLESLPHEIEIELAGVQDVLLLPVAGRDGQSIRIAGSVPTYADLPTTGLVTGDLWVVAADGLGYVWNGSSFPADGDGVAIKGDKGDTGDTGRGYSAVGVDGDTLVFTVTTGGTETVLVPALSAANAAASAAAGHATNAEGFSDAAEGYATAAHAEALVAATDAAAASDSAGVAEGHADAASGSASTAAGHATTAGTSAGAASASAITAGAYAGDAEEFADLADGSATAAATSASNAADSADTATTQASNAATSASTAGNHATTAGNHATAAANSAGDAADSAAEAASYVGAPAAGSVGTTQLQNAAVTDAKLADDSVHSWHIVGQSVDLGKLHPEVTTAMVSTVEDAVADLVGQAPETLDTLSELASALGNDPNFATTVTAQIGTKANSTDPRLSDTRTPTPGTLPADLVWVSHSGTRKVGVGDLAAGMYVGRAFVVDSLTYQFDTPDASGSTTLSVQKNGTNVVGAQVTVSAANQVDGTGTDGARTVTLSDASRTFAVGDRFALNVSTVGVTPGKGCRVYVHGWWS